MIHNHFLDAVQVWRDYFNDKISMQMRDSQLRILRARLARS